MVLQQSGRSDMDKKAEASDLQDTKFSERCQIRIIETNECACWALWSLPLARLKLNNVYGVKSSKCQINLLLRLVEHLSKNSFTIVFMFAHTVILSHSPSHPNFNVQTYLSLKFESCMFLHRPLQFLVSKKACSLYCWQFYLANPCTKCERSAQASEASPAREAIQTHAHSQRFLPCLTVFFPHCTPHLNFNVQTYLSMKFESCSRTSFFMLVCLFLRLLVSFFCLLDCLLVARCFRRICMHLAHEWCMQLSRAWADLKGCRQIVSGAMAKRYNFLLVFMNVFSALLCIYQILCGYDLVLRLGSSPMSSTSNPKDYNVIS